MYKKNVRYIIDMFDNSCYLNDFLNSLYINEGSSRIVFHLNQNSKFVVKISKNTIQDYLELNFNERKINNGIQQSLKEIEIWNNCNSFLKEKLNPIIDYGIYNGYIYIVQEYVNTIEDIFGDYTLEEACEESENNIQDYKIIIEDLSKIYSLSSNDIYYAPSNIGLNKNNEIVIIDYGFIG